MAHIIPLLGGVRGGSLGREISVNISRITDLPTPKSPPKRGLSNLMIRAGTPPPTEGFKKPGIFQCPGAEKVKRVEIIDVLCPHCHAKGTTSVAGFEHEFACEK